MTVLLSVRRNPGKLRLLVTAAILLVALGEHASAGIVKFSAPLSATTGSRATGSAHFYYDTDSHQLSSDIVFGALNSLATAAHIRDGGSVVVDYPVPESPISGTATLSPSQSSALLGGKLTLDVDTQKLPGGELKGRIVRDRAQ